MNKQVAFAVLVSIAGGSIYGYNTAIIGGIGEDLITNVFFPNEDEDVQAVYQGLLTADILVGAFFGSFISVFFADKFGRKKALALCGLYAAVFAILLSMATNYFVNVLTRTNLGVAVGFTGTLVPLYSTESTPREIRGKVGTVFQIAVCGSILLAQVTNYGFNPNEVENLPEWKWRIQFALGAVPALVLLLLSFIIPESRIWLNEREANRYPKAQDSSGRRNAKGNLYSIKGLRWIFVGIILAASQQLTGINAVIFYSPRIFTDAGFDNVLVLTIAVVGTWNLLTVFVSFALVDRLGRRILMLSALTIMALGLGVLGLAYAAFPEQKGPVAIASVMIFLLGFEIGPGPLFFLMATETFPDDVRDQALSFTNAAGWFFNICISFMFPVINTSLGPSATFFLLFGVAVLSGICIFLFLPETKDKVVGGEARQEEARPILSVVDG